MFLTVTGSGKALTNGNSLPPGEPQEASDKLWNLELLQVVLVKITCFIMSVEFSDNFMSVTSLY